MRSALSLTQTGQGHTRINAWFVRVCHSLSGKCWGGQLPSNSNNKMYIIRLPSFNTSEMKFQTTHFMSISWCDSVGMDMLFISTVCSWHRKLAHWWFWTSCIYFVEPFGNIQRRLPWKVFEYWSLLNMRKELWQVSLEECLISKGCGTGFSYAPIVRKSARPLTLPEHEKAQDIP